MQNRRYRPSCCSEKSTSKLRNRVIDKTSIDTRHTGRLLLLLLFFFFFVPMLLVIVPTVILIVARVIFIHVRIRPNNAIEERDLMSNVSSTSYSVFGIVSHLQRGPWVGISRRAFLVSPDQIPRCLISSCLGYSSSALVARYLDGLRCTPASLQASVPETKKKCPAKLSLATFGLTLRAPS